MKERKALRLLKELINKMFRRRKVFIIGNGFDSAHGMKTSYDYFRMFLVENYDVNSSITPFEVDRVLTETGEYEYRDRDIASIFVYLIDNLDESDLGNEQHKLWEHFEHYLSKINADDFVFEDFLIVEDDGVLEPFATSINFELEGNIVFNGYSMLEEFFSQWVSEISLENVAKLESFESLSTRSDYFLTFNYTDTLERVYGYVNVLHVHGRWTDNIVFGHGVNFEAESDPYISDCTIRGIQDMINLKYRKPVEQVYDKYRNEFKDYFMRCDDIYFFGFSFSDVDMYYFTKVFSSVSTVSKRIFLNNYDIDKFDVIKRKLIESGYKGIFDSY